MEGLAMCPCPAKTSSSKTSSVYSLQNAVRSQVRAKCLCVIGTALPLPQEMATHTLYLAGCSPASCHTSARVCLTVAWSTELEVPYKHTQVLTECMHREGCEAASPSSPCSSVKPKALPMSLLVPVSPSCPRQTLGEDRSVVIVLP